MPKNSSSFCIIPTIFLVGSLILSCTMPTAASSCECSLPSLTNSSSSNYTPPEGADNFYRSANVTCRKVAFCNQYKMRVVGNLFMPMSQTELGNGSNSSMAAIIVGHPMGAVKEQSANLYAQKLAEQGFVTLAIDLSFFGESEGQPRNDVLPDVYAEDFSAAVDYLGTQQPIVDRNRIGVLGICGSGGFVISAAKLDPRMRAIATVSMYDMGAANRDGLRNSQSAEQRAQVLAAAAEQRYVEFTVGEIRYQGLPLELDTNTNAVVREFFDFYRTPRGQYVPEGSTLVLTTSRPSTGEVKFMNFNPFIDIQIISPRAMLFVAGENAHSREWSEQAYQLAAEPKQLLIVPGAGHVDLYDRVNLIPFDQLISFFAQNLGRRSK